MQSKIDNLTPKQLRSQKSQQRILNSTLALLESRHFETMTIADIAKHAGMAVGNFYKRFKNKEALLPHLYAEYNRRFATFAAATPMTPEDDPWPYVVKSTITFFEENKGLIRALHLNSRLNPNLVPKGSTETRGGLYRALEPLVSKQGLSDSARERRARMAALAMVSTITEAILYPDMTPAAASGMATDTFAEELLSLLKEYSC